MTITISPLSEAEARQALSWTYEPPYDLYNSNPAQLDENVRNLLDPANACYSLRPGPDEQTSELTGYCCFGRDGQVPGGNYASPALDIGLGIRPDLTGQGRGSRYIQAVLAFARRTFDPQALRVTIAAFNQRAVRAWQKAGFQEVQRFNRTGTGLEFIVLVLETR